MYHFSQICCAEVCVSDVEVLVYYGAHFNAVIINIAKVVLC